MALVQRHFLPYLRRLLGQFPAICILGPRQCGKTTFAKQVLTGWRYLDLEKPSDLAKIADDPEGALHHWQGHIIFDEAQRLPSLFPVLRSIIDEHRGKKGRFVLLGSASFDLIRGISESLAGRVGFLDMTPFHMNEVPSWQHLWIRGGFPDAYLQKDPTRRNEWFEGYLRTFIERDLWQLGLRVSASQMRKLLTMLAHLHGGQLNATELGSSLGVSYHTVNHYLDILEQTFLVRRLRPYFVNIGKRLVKNPKVYIRDSGLLHYLLGISSLEDLEGHPKKGASWEGFVIEGVTGSAVLQAPGTEAHFFRTSTGREIDLLLKAGGSLTPIEIKTQIAPRRGDLGGLPICMKDLHLQKGYVLRPSGERYSLGDGIDVLTPREFMASLG